MLVLGVLCFSVDASSDPHAVNPHAVNLPRINSAPGLAQLSDNGTIDIIGELRRVRGGRFCRRPRAWRALLDVCAPCASGRVEAVWRQHARARACAHAAMRIVICRSAVARVCRRVVLCCRAKSNARAVA